MSRRKASGNLQFALSFFLLLGGIIFISLLLRTFFLVSETKFDGSSHFTLQLNEVQTVQYLSFSPQSSDIGILSLKNTPPLFEIPVDAKTNYNLQVNTKNLKLSLFKMFFDFKNQKEINFVDIFRLMLFSGTIKENSITQTEISDKTEKFKIDAVVSTLFLDPKIQEEKLNVEIVNSADVYGLGNKLANLVTNTGANVVLVSTGDIRKESVIEHFESSYTVEKLSKILGFRKVKMEKKNLADVKIIVGYSYVHLEQ